MTASQTPRWYSVNNIGMATLCADQADAENVARECDIEWPRQAPHQAVQLVELSELEKERAARQEAQQRIADMQELSAKAGLAHRKAVQAAVSDAMKRMQAGEKLSYTDKDVELIMLGWQSDLKKTVADEREACKSIAVAEQKTMLESAKGFPMGVTRDLLFARARSAESIAQAIEKRGTP